MMSTLLNPNAIPNAWAANQALAPGQTANLHQVLTPAKRALMRTVINDLGNCTFCAGAAHTEGSCPSRWIIKKRMKAAGISFEWGALLGGTFPPDAQVIQNAKMKRYVRQVAKNGFKGKKSYY